MSVDLARALKWKLGKNLSRALADTGEKHHALLYGPYEKGNTTLIFAQLVVKRQLEYFQAVLILSRYNYTDAVVPIMRALCDTLYLLEYVDQKSAYIAEFMETTKARGIDLRDIKKVVKDPLLKEYYTKLSDFMHSNPIGIKADYEVSPDSGDRMIWLFDPSREVEIQQHIVHMIWIFTKSEAIINRLIKAG